MKKILLAGVILFPFAIAFGLVPLSCSYSEANCPSCNKTFKAADLECPRCHNKTLKFIDKKTLQCECKKCGSSDIFLDHPSCGYIR
jgi:hypothetical protein